MAQLNITLNQDEFLQLLFDNREEAFRTLLERTLNQVLLAESKEQLQAGPYEHTEERKDSRNGFRQRELRWSAYLSVFHTATLWALVTPL